VFVLKVLRGEASAYGGVEPIQVTGRYHRSSSRLRSGRAGTMAGRDLEPGGRRARGGCRRARGTAWGLLGLYDWCDLCTRGTGAYEPGVLTWSSGKPVRTSLTELVIAACKRDVAAAPGAPVARVVAAGTRDLRFRHRRMPLLISAILRSLGKRSSRRPPQRTQVTFASKAPADRPVPLTWLDPRQTSGKLIRAHREGLEGD